MAKAFEQSRNIAILAHVDAGKTTVSERLLYFSDTIPGTGEVDEGLATMDYLEEEKKRGITIEAGIASYTWKGTRVTFVDTPGHVDFGVEVDFALRAVEGVVLVLSGVSGIESQSLEAWGKIRSNKNTPILFINKLDLVSADWKRVLDQIRVMFAVKPLVLTFPIFDGDRIDGVVDVIHQLALYRSAENPRKLIKGDIPARHRADYEHFRKELIDATSEHNDAVLTAYLAGQESETEALLAGIRAAMLNGQHIPVLMGSAIKNVGVRQLMNSVNQLLPAPHIPAGDVTALGLVIKIRVYPNLGRIYLTKIYSDEVVKRLEAAKYFRVFAESLEPIQDVSAGDIVAIQSPKRYVMGQYLARDGRSEGPSSKGYRPLLQSRIELERADDWPHVDQVLRQLSDTEPSIAIETDPNTGGWLISTVGELQLDVFCRRLRQEHQCDVRIGLPTVRYLERLKSSQLEMTGSAHAFGTDIKLVLDATPSSETDLNKIEIALPYRTDKVQEVVDAIFSAFCTKGICGYGQVIGLKIKVKEIVSGISPVPPPLLAKCLQDTLQMNFHCESVEVYEPLMRLEIIIPDEFCGSVLEDLAARGGVIRKMDSDGYNSIILLEIPLASTFGYTTFLRSLSRGLGVYVLTYEKHGLRRSV